MVSLFNRSRTKVAECLLKLRLNHITYRYSQFDVPIDCLEFFSFFFLSLTVPVGTELLKAILFNICFPMCYSLAVAFLSNRLIFLYIVSFYLVCSLLSSFFSLSCFLYNIIYKLFHLFSSHNKIGHLSFHTIRIGLYFFFFLTFQK